jgi:hypothetical protein
LGESSHVVLVKYCQVKKDVHCCDATASSFVAKVQGEVFANFRAVVKCQSSMPNSLACQVEFFMNNTVDVEENDEHGLDCALHLSRLSRSWRVWIFPLVGLLLCLRVIIVNPGLVTSDNPAQDGCVT